MRIVIHCDDGDVGDATAIAEGIEEGPLGALWVGEVELINWGKEGHVENLDMGDVGCGGVNVTVSNRNDVVTEFLARHPEVSASRMACDFTS